VGKENSNGHRLLQFCRNNNLVIINSEFGEKMVHKLTWFSHGCKTDNLIYYFIVNQRLTGSTQDARIYRSAAFDVKSKDHHLVMSRVSLKLKFRDVTTFREVPIQEELDTKLEI